MADKESQAKEVETTVEEVDKPKSDDVIVEKEKVVEKNGDSENGAEDKDDKVEEEEKEKNGHEETDKVCTIKRKSTGGDTKDETPVEGVIPEKKAKIDEPAEAESNGDATEVAA